MIYARVDMLCMVSNHAGSVLFLHGSCLLYKLQHAEHENCPASPAKQQLRAHWCLKLSGPTLRNRQNHSKGQTFISHKNACGSLQALRFGASMAACNQAMNLGFAWSKQKLSSAAQEDMQSIQQHAQEVMQKVLGPEVRSLAYSYVTLPCGATWRHRM